MASLINRRNATHHHPTLPLPSLLFQLKRSLFPFCPRIITYIVKYSIAFVVLLSGNSGLHCLLILFNLLESWHELQLASGFIGRISIWSDALSVISKECMSMALCSVSRAHKKKLARRSLCFSTIVVMCACLSICCRVVTQRSKSPCRISRLILKLLHGPFVLLLSFRYFLSLYLIDFHRLIFYNYILSNDLSYRFIGSALQSLFQHPVNLTVIKPIPPTK